MMDVVAWRGYVYSGLRMPTKGLSEKRIEDLKFKVQEITYSNGYSVIWINSSSSSEAFIRVK